MDTIETIYKNIEKLYDVDNDLIDILAVAGRDSETTYKDGYLDMLIDMKSLQEAIHGILDNFNDTINDIEYWLEPLPVKTPSQPAMDAMADELPSETDFNKMEEVAKAAGL